MKGEDQDPRTILASRLREDGIRDAEVLRAIATVRRDRFVPPEHVSDAYEDRPLPIGSEQTISQPFVVAYMTELLTPLRGKRVLEVGTGSGYQAAVLAELGAEVFSIEILPELSTAARAALTRAGYERVELRVGDGYAGWSEKAPFDRILVAAAADAIPRPLVAQLAGGGRLVMPVEDADTGEQWIRILDKGSDGSTKEQRAIAVRFVPMTGEAERR